MGDTIFFFEKSAKLSSIFSADPIRFLRIVFFSDYDISFVRLMGDVAENIPRTVFFVKVVSLLNIVTGDNYWIDSLYLSLFCFAGSWRLVSVLSRQYPAQWLPILASFLVFPSAIFWSSGVLKESIFMGALYFALSYILEFLDNRSALDFYKVFLLVFNLWLLFCLKYFLFAIFMAVFCSYGFTVLIIPSNVKIAWKLPANALIFGVLILIATQLHYALSFRYFIHELVTYHDEIFVYTINDVGKEHASLVHFGTLTENILTVIDKIPEAIFNGLFMPLPIRLYSIFQMVTACENLAVLLLSLWSITVFVQRPCFDLLKMSMITYVLICAGIFALTSPNLGTLARYKVAYLPFLLFLITSNTLQWGSKEQGISKE